MLAPCNARFEPGRERPVLRELTYPEESKRDSRWLSRYFSTEWSSGYEEKANDSFSDVEHLSAHIGEQSESKRSSTVDSQKLSIIDKLRQYAGISRASGYKWNGVESIFDEMGEGAPALIDWRE
ncbi:hypothetical protein EVAR_2256_1 [Eumeta japonica]|uniref:Uncharacterized protein n=1 Tax=Eumeta variegata TaxID=151549 RepID=A0A4C1SIB8_EUMVA|nr:hypothetical protein EVAR_2256_1 [Eumeta japonica]